MGMISQHRHSGWEQGLPFLAAAHPPWGGPCLLSLTPHPLPLCTSTARAGSHHRTFHHSTKSTTGQGKAGSWGITAPASHLALSPAFLWWCGGTGESSNGGVTRPSRKSKPAQSLSRWQHRAFWAIFGHFRRSPWSVCRTATTPSPFPGQILAQSLFLQSTLAPLQLCPPSFEVGHNCSSHHFFAFPQHQSGCMLSLPAGPLPEAVKTHAVKAWFTKHPGVKVNWL